MSRAATIQTRSRLHRSRDLFANRRSSTTVSVVRPPVQLLGAPSGLQCPFLRHESQSSPNGRDGSRSAHRPATPCRAGRSTDSRGFGGVRQLGSFTHPPRFSCQRATPRNTGDEVNRTLTRHLIGSQANIPHSQTIFGPAVFPGASGSLPVHRPLVCAHRGRPLTSIRSDSCLWSGSEPSPSSRGMEILPSPFLLRLHVPPRPFYPGERGCRPLPASGFRRTRFRRTTRARRESSVTRGKEACAWARDCCRSRRRPSTSATPPGL